MKDRIARAEMVLPAGPDLAATIAFLAARLGLRVEAISPADSPVAATLSGHGVRLRLEPGAREPGLLRLACEGEPPPAEVAPNGTRIEYVVASREVALPPLVPGFVLGRGGAGAAWGTGRAGMRYRDLVPGRLGGRYIASHIAIPEGGPVPDYVHFHRVRFQAIFCRKGWVRVVYEDQGEEFVMHPGDCVLQPPGIRHRVLEASDGLEVVEIGCPAEHETLGDLDMALPNARIDRARLFDGQRFVRHEAGKAAWASWRLPGFEARDIGIAAATSGLADMRVVRPLAPGAAARWTHAQDFQLVFVLSGTLRLDVDGHGTHGLGPDDSFVVPAGIAHGISAASADLELLEVSVRPQ
ncbi:MAG: hypothetical protein RLZZ276_1881 [Pseudomonadota bacterium]|jgi:quercetin dioxygenase-like cupin family protein